MLPKTKRLNREGFDKVYESGSSVQTDVGYAKYASTGRRQVACVVSKSNVKKSVDRTRIRRRAYAVVQEYFSQIPDGISIIWFLPKKAQAIEKQYLEDSFKNILQAINNTNW
jgi:ribonuclease P protein component